VVDRRLALGYTERVSNDVEFIDPDPVAGPGRRAGRAASVIWPSAVALGWALAAVLALVAPFLPFAVYPRWHGGPVAAPITLKQISLDGWTTQGEEPTVGIVLAICAALFAANAIVQLLRHSSRGLERWKWAGVVASPPFLLGVVSMLVVYLLTGTTRRAQLPVPAAQPSVRAPTLAAGPHAVQVVRSAEPLRSGCLWLSVAAALFALAALVVQLNTAHDLGPPGRNTTCERRCQSEV
jgi:hypothetical protein